MAKKPGENAKPKGTRPKPPPAPPVPTRRRAASAPPAAVDSIITIHGETVPTAELQHLHPAIRCFAVRTDSLKRDPENARRHGERNLLSTANSLRRFGQQASGVILFDPASRTIKVGSGRHEVATDAKWGLNWPWIAAAPSNLSVAELKAMAIADNRTAELADWDADTLERQLAELGEDLETFDAGDVGFDAKELDALLNGKVVDAHGFVPPKPKKAPAAEDETFEPQWKVIIHCTGEAQQADLIEECERRGLNYSAPSL